VCRVLDILDLILSCQFRVQFQVCAVHLLTNWYRNYIRHNTAESELMFTILLEAMR